jgi:hypothetical protein
MTYIAQELNLSLEFVDFSESYQARMNKWSNVPIERPYTLNTSGNPMNTSVEPNRGGLLPPWFKESNCYQILSALLYPVIAKLYSPHKRVSGMCAIFHKK